MRLAVFGATGATGRQVVRLALQAGHEVTAVVRDPGRLVVDDPNLQVVRADIFDAAALEPVLEGRDAALSTLGGSGGVCARSARSILQAMGPQGCGG